jgi:hypothetical protein
MRSKLFSLNLRDFLKGMLYAILSAVITFAASQLQGGVPLDLELLKKCGMVALSTLIAYVGANLFQNSKGEFLTKEP